MQTEPEKSVSDPKTPERFSTAEGSSPDAMLLSEDGHPPDLTGDGSLGILALGYAGIMLWRNKRSASTGTNPDS